MTKESTVSECVCAVCVCVCVCVGVGGYGCVHAYVRACDHTSNAYKLKHTSGCTYIYRSHDVPSVEHSLPSLH